jgi:hypothetical protein
MSSSLCLNQLSAARSARFNAAMFFTPASRQLGLTEIVVVTNRPQ